MWLCIVIPGKSTSYICRSCLRGYEKWVWLGIYLNVSSKRAGNLPWTSSGTRKSDATPCKSRGHPWSSNTKEQMGSYESAWYVWLFQKIWRFEVITELLTNLLKKTPSLFKQKPVTALLERWKLFCQANLCCLLQILMHLFSLQWMPVTLVWGQCSRK